MEIGERGIEEDGNGRERDKRRVEMKERGIVEGGIGRERDREGGN